jgi:hypothetical protein
VAGWSVKRLVAAVAGAAAVVAGFLRLRQGRRPAAEVEPGPSPADELRARLDETRAAEEASEPAAPEPAGEPAAGETPSDVDARREEVHERARQAIDELE